MVPQATCSPARQCWIRAFEHAAGEKLIPYRVSPGVWTVKAYTVRVDESQKRVNKIQKLRSMKVKRSAQQPEAAAPAAPAASEAAPEPSPAV